MATIQATTATTTGTVAASDRYEVTVASGIFTAATATTPSSTVWSYGSGKLTISNDIFNPANYINVVPDTLAIKYIEPSNLITNEWGA